MRQRVFLCWLLIAFCSCLTNVQAGEKVNQWRHPGRNPSVLGNQAIDSLSVPPGVKDGLHQAVADSAYQLTTVFKGTVFRQMTFGGVRKGSRFKVWGPTVCAWDKLDSLTSQQYTFATDSLINDSLAFRYYWTLSHFDTCDNVAWRLFRQKINIVRVPISVEPPVYGVLEEVVYQPVFQRHCPKLGAEAFSSTGFIGQYGYASQGGRVNFFPCQPSWLALSAKAMFAGQPPYAPSTELGHESGVVYHPMYLSQDFKGGLRLRTHWLETEILYSYLGTQRYRWNWKAGLSWENELIVHYQRWQVEQIVVWLSGVDYFWERSRVKYNYRINDNTRWRIGWEGVWEGHDHLTNPQYYYTRSGLLWEVFQLFGDGRYWWDAAVHSGYGSWGWYLGAEFNIAVKPIIE